MAEEFETVRIEDNFFRDSIGKVIIILICVVLATVMVVGISLYLYLDKPPPVGFGVDNDWRVQGDVPVDQPYLSDTDVLQWVSNALQKSFVYDYYHYNDQLKAASKNFTPDGWKVFLNQLNIYANYNNVQAGKVFVSGTPAEAPFIQNKGLLNGRYSWWVQLPININYTGYAPNTPNKTLTLQVLVVRVPTLNNLNGVGIENLIVANSNNQSIQ